MTAVNGERERRFRGLGAGFKRDSLGIQTSFKRRGTNSQIAPFLSSYSSVLTCRLTTELSNQYVTDSAMWYTTRDLLYYPGRASSDGLQEPVSHYLDIKIFARWQGCS